MHDMKRISKKVLFIVLVFCASLNVTAQQYQVPVSEVHEKMQTGQYEPRWESLETHQTPEWFRDAKFGIWAHWGPQCVEGSGDWMARGLYQEGSGQYKYHVEHYGHPSEVGFKDILPLFKALVKKQMDYYHKVKMEKKYGANRIAGEEFLKANAKKDSIKVTPSGLQYKVLTAGTGDIPTKENKVKVNYEGHLIDGTEFDSSYKRNKPVTFPKYP